MNRRRFLELLGSAALGSGIVYSFPSVIKCKNIKLSEESWIDYIRSKDRFGSIDELYELMDRDLKAALATLDKVIWGEPYNQPNRTLGQIYDDIVGTPDYLGLRPNNV